MAYTAINEKSFREKGGSLSKKITTELALIATELTDIQLLKWKQSVKCATTANGTLATAFANGQSVDGYTLVTGDRILIKDQTDQTVRGIYTVNATGAPTRSVDMDAGTEFPGAVVAVENGTVNADSAWVCTNDSVTLTSTNIVFAIFGGLKAGANLIITADVIGVDPAGFTASQLVRLNSGGTALEAAGATALGTNEASWTTDLDTTAGKIRVLAVGGGTNNTLTIQNQVLSGDVAITLPNATSQLATLALSETLTGKNINCNAAALGTGTGTPIIKYGDIDTAVSYLLTASFVPMQVNVSGGGVGVGTLGAGYFRTATGIAQTGQLATLMVRAALGHNVLDAYGMQSHMSITANMGTTNANAHLTAISGKITLTNTPTVATGWGTAGLFILEGAGSFTQMCSAVSLVQEAGCSAAKEMLYINNDGTATVGINFVGNFTKGITFNNATVSQGLDNFILSLGTINSTISYTPSDSYVPIQVNLTSIADHGTSGNETIGATYFRTATSTANQPNHQLATCMVRVKVANNIWDAYGVQSHLSFGNVTVSTTGANAHLTAISGKVTFDTTTVSKGWVTAGLFIIEGAGTCSQMCHGVSIVNEAGSTGAQSMLHLNDDVGTVPYFSFAGADGDGKGIYTGAVPDTLEGSIMVLINNVAHYIPVYASQHT